jgi:hypothetical protein
LSKECTLNHTNFSQTFKTNTTMKKVFLSVFFAVGLIVSANAQVKVGNNPTTITPSAVLDVESTNKGFMPPRVALTSKTDNTTIAAPATGLVVFNTGTGGFTPAGLVFWNGSEWAQVATSGSQSANTPFAIGEVRSTVVNSGSIFGTSTTGTSKSKMTSKTAVGSTTRRSMFESAAPTETFIVFEGLRMDFLRNGGYADPTLFNTTTSNINYSIVSLSTVNAYVNGADCNINANAYAYGVDGNDGVYFTQDDAWEYNAAQIFFPATGRWYQATWSALWTNGTTYGLFTVQRLR